MLILLLLFIFVFWLVYTASTLEDPALTMHKEGNRDQLDYESDIPSEEMLNNEGWEKIDVLYDECEPGLVSWVYRSESLDKYRVITGDEYSKLLHSDIFVSSPEEAKAEFQKWLDEYDYYNG